MIFYNCRIKKRSKYLKKTTTSTTFDCLIRTNLEVSICKIGLKVYTKSVSRFLPGRVCRKGIFERTRKVNPHREG